MAKLNHAERDSNEINSLQGVEERAKKDSSRCHHAT